MNDVLYSTEDLSRMFQVGKSTIKRWTDEGKLQCFKTPGGHRKFRAENVRQFISHYHYEVSTPVLTVVKETAARREFLFSRSLSAVLDECLQNAVKGRKTPIEQAFSALFAEGRTLAGIFDDVLTPVVRTLRSRFAEGLLSTIEFQIARSTLLTSMIHFTELIPRTDTQSGEIYCLAVDEGMNDVELKAVELVLDNKGVTVYNLGNVLNKFSASDIVNQCRPEDVFVVLSLAGVDTRTEEQLTSLVSGVRSYGGTVYTSGIFAGPDNAAPVTDTKRFSTFTEIADRVGELVRV